MENETIPFIIHDQKAQDRITWVKEERSEWEIGSGSFGTVYKCKLDGHVTAVKKVLFINSLGSRCTPQDVKKVVDLWKDLDHKNIIKYIDHVMDGRAAYLFMEYAVNGSLNTYLKRQRKTGLTLELFFRWGKDICEGLDYLHGRENPILHRDLTTGNCLLDKDLILKLSDFDFSKEIKISSSSLISSNGAPIYTAPELLKRRRDANDSDGRSDIFAVGFLLWEMLTCSLPMEGKNCEEQLKTMQFVLDTQNGIRPVFPSYCPEYLKNIINSCWRPTIRLRPSSAAVLKQRLEECERHLYSDFGIPDHTRLPDLKGKSEKKYFFMHVMSLPYNRSCISLARAEDRLGITLGRADNLKFKL